jgi:hypothetical protein
MRIEMVTWKDLVDHTIDYLGATPSAEARRDGRRATLEALRDLASAGEWTYYYDRFRLDIVGPYLTGTLSYDHTGGAYERLLTLVGGTWPSWAALGSIVLDNIPYEVDRRIDDTRITLTENANPGADATPAAWTLYRDTYPLALRLPGRGHDHPDRPHAAPGARAPQLLAGPPEDLPGRGHAAALLHPGRPQLPEHAGDQLLPGAGQHLPDGHDLPPPAAAHEHRGVHLGHRVQHAGLRGAGQARAPPGPAGWKGPSCGSAWTPRRPPRGGSGPTRRCWSGRW